MHEMWKRKQIHEDVRKNVQDYKAWQNGEDNNWEAMILSEGRTDMEKSWYVAESVRDTRGNE